MLVTTLAGLVAAFGLQAPADLPDRPCKFEDSTNCVWDARHMGNGRGTSFVVMGPRKDPIVVKVRHRVAHRLLAD